MKIFTCPQLSDEWWELHRGVPTASSFDRILTPKTLKPSAQQEDLVAELIAQKFMDGPMGAENGYQSQAMKNGIALEPEARRWYAMEMGVDPQLVGFCLDDAGQFGASPDSLVGDDGGLEIKCPTLKTHTKYLLKGELPAEYLGQVHGELIVTGREWIDFVSYAPGLNPLRVRVVPDKYTAALREELARFWDKYQKALELVSRR